MSALLTPQAHAAFKAKLEGTMAHILATGQIPTPEGIASEISLDVQETLLEAFAEGLAAGVGREMSEIAMADLTSRADKPNGELAGGRRSRAAVAKSLNKIRRNLGLPLRCPNNARAGRKPKAPQSQ